MQVSVAFSYLFHARNFNFDLVENAVAFLASTTHIEVQIPYGCSLTTYLSFEIVILQQKRASVNCLLLVFEQRFIAKVEVLVRNDFL